MLVGRGGTIGLMQIKLATARGLGYTGDAAGLRDPNTNLTYAVKYLAGAYRAANGDANRAVGYYAGGYYYAAKRQRVAGSRHQQAPAVDGFWDARAEQVPARAGPAPKSVQSANARVDTPRHRLTLALFRGGLR